MPNKEDCTRVHMLLLAVRVLFDFSVSMLGVGMNLIILRFNSDVEHDMHNVGRIRLDRLNV